eukprot:5875857-Pyramimonas_sp.AAC.1
MPQLVLLAPLDAVQAAFPLRAAREVQIGAAAGDSGLHKVGSSEQPKSRVLASCPELRAQLATALRAKRVTGVQSERNLGIDYAAGGVIKRHAKLERMNASRVRHKKILTLSGKLARSRVHRMVRAAAQASTSYGSGVMGCNGRELTLARFQQASVQSQKLAGRSIPLMLQSSGMPRMDPAHHLNVSPLLSIASSLWDGRVPRVVVVQ